MPMRKKKHSLSSLYEDSPNTDLSEPLYPPDQEAVSVKEYAMFEGVQEEAPTYDDGTVLAEEHVDAIPESATIDEPAIEDGVDANSQALQDLKLSQDQVKEVVIVCTSCTTILFTDHDGPCPYSSISKLGSEHESYSWLLHTTCSSCIGKYKPDWETRETFSNQCTAAFETALFSEEFMKQTRWFRAAERVCRRPLKVLMGQGQRSVAYVKSDDFRQESRPDCRMRLLKPLDLRRAKSGSTDMLESYMPGGFL